MRATGLKRLFSGVLIALVAVVAGCSSTNMVNLNVHTEPEGAHVIYRLNNDSWTYIGITPLDAVKILEDKELGSKSTFTLKAMRCGYLDQVKEWSGTDLLTEQKEKGKIFWTPRLIKNTE